MNCTYCGKAYKDSYMYIHQRVCFRNPNKIRFHCKVCSKEFTTRTNLCEHSRKHTTTRGTQTENTMVETILDITVEPTEEIKVEPTLDI